LEILLATTAPENLKFLVYYSCKPDNREDLWRKHPTLAVTRNFQVTQGRRAKGRRGSA